MTIDTLIVFALAGMLAAFSFVLWFVAAQRRRARRKAEVAAALRRKHADPSWERLSHSAAGAP